MSAPASTSRRLAAGMIVPRSRLNEAVTDLEMFTAWIAGGAELDRERLVAELTSHCRNLRSVMSRPEREK